jgi:predicted Zn finger-like uncharacterized protein
MIIECPNCNSQFNYNGNANLLGKKIKCSSCNYSWIYLPDEPIESLQNIVQSNIETKIEPKVESTPELTAKVMKRDVSKLSFVLSFATFLMFSVLTISLYLLIHIDEHPSLYKYAKFIGYSPNNSLKLSLVKCELRALESSNDRYSEHEIGLEVNIYNIYDVEEVADKIRIAVYDKEIEFIDELIMPVAKTIPPKAFEVFEGRLNRIPKEATFVVVDIGSEAEIKLRKRAVLSKI